MISFKPIDLNTKDLYQHYYQQIHNEVSELTFTNLYMWRNKYHFKYAVIGDYFWILNETDDGRWFFSPPIGDYNDDLEKSIILLQAYLINEGHPFIIKKAGTQVLEQLLQLDGFKIEHQANLDAFDYIYDFESLCELKGNAYHKKRNHVNKFLKTYNDWQYLPLSEAHLEDVHHCLNLWCQTHECHADPELQQEHQAILDALKHFEHLDFEGGLIQIDGMTEAFTLAEKLNSTTLVIHIEKANTEYHGLYNMINREYLMNTALKAQYVNREQDLGIPGLRKSKLSYHPIKMIEKHVITLL